MATTTAPTPAPAHLRAGATRPAVALVRRAVADRMTLASVVGVLMVGMGLMVGALWPPLQDVFAEFETSLPAAFDAMLGASPLSTPVGWVNAELLSLTAPAAAIAVAVVSAGRATAGEEDAKTLGLLLSAPVGRVTLLLAKAAAMVVHVLVVGAFLGAGMLLGSALGDLGLTLGGVAGAVAHVAALAVLFGCVAVLVGSGTGRRRLTTVVTSGLASVAFLAATFLPLSDATAGTERLSPWYYLSAADPLANGADAGHLLLLLGAAAAVLLAAVAVFRRRDLRG